ncbi:MAG: hypothetical protein FE835_19695, partial [Gammaproteobacteria bacterium]|nr:hypothetical protein [Gammaproteobacteria bacterium]
LLQWETDEQVGHDTRNGRSSSAEYAATTETGVRPNNETLFLLKLLAYEILHVGHTLMEKATHEGWSLRRFRERVLRTASRVVCHGRRLIFVITQALMALLPQNLKTEDLKG